MAFALAAALARKHAPGEIKEIHLKGSGLMVTGVQAVLIPTLTADTAALSPPPWVLSPVTPTWTWRS